MKKKLIIMFITVALLLSGCTTGDVQVDIKDDIKTISENIASNLVKGEYKKVIEDYVYSSKVKQAINEDVLKKIMGGVTTQSGNFIKIKDFNQSQVNGLDTIVVVCEYEKLYINIILSYDKNKIINGFFIRAGDIKLETNENTVVFGLDDFKLNGELTLPEGKGPFPVVIIVHGSGSSDMDCSIGENKPYLDIANGLRDKGIAVLRYNKRSYQYKEEVVKLKDATVYDEFIQDSVLAVEYLKSRTEIDNNNIFILTHSQSGYLLPRIANHNLDVKGFIGFAAMATRLEDLILEQTEYLINLDGTVTTEEQQHLEQIKDVCKSIKEIDKVPDGSYILGSPKSYYLDLKEYDHLTDIKSILRPVFFMQGERDYQVTMEQFNKWKDATKGMKNFSFKSYPDLNHLFLPGSGKPNPNEYYVKGNVSGDVIDDIAMFIEINK